MVTQRQTAITSPRGRKFTIRQDSLAPELFSVRWGREGEVALIDMNQGLIEIDPKLPEDVTFALQLFIAQELNLDTEDLAAFEVEFKRIR